MSRTSWCTKILSILVLMYIWNGIQETQCRCTSWHQFAPFRTCIFFCNNQIEFQDALRNNNENITYFTIYLPKSNSALNSVRQCVDKIALTIFALSLITDYTTISHCPFNLFFCEFSPVKFENRKNANCKNALPQKSIWYFKCLCCVFVLVIVCIYLQMT